MSESKMTPAPGTLIVDLDVRVSLRNIVTAPALVKVPVLASGDERYPAGCKILVEAGAISPFEDEYRDRGHVDAGLVLASDAPPLVELPEPDDF